MLALVGTVAVLPGCGAAEIEDASGAAGSESGTARLSSPKSGGAGRKLPGTRSLRREVFDGFEKRSGWVIDGADDKALLTRSNARATQGRRSLHVVAKTGNRRKVSIRRDVSIDLGGVRSVSVDVWAEAEGLKLALALVTQPDYAYHETRPADIPAGWNTVTFRLDGPHMKTAETRWQHEAVLANAQGTERIVLVLYTGKVKECDVYLDRFSFEGQHSSVEARLAPRNVKVRAAARRAPMYGTFEVGVSVEASHGSPFAPGQIQAFADFQAPSGEAARVPAFITSDGAWLVRYMPLEPGRHSYRVSVQNRFGRVTTFPRSFLAERVPAIAPIRVSPRDARQFEYATGEAF